MIEEKIYSKVQLLPEDRKLEVLDYIESLLNKYKEKRNIHMVPKFGCMKGVFKMSQDFDEPLEDFKEYMP